MVFGHDLEAWWFVHSLAETLGPVEHLGHRRRHPGLQIQLHQHPVRQKPSCWSASVARIPHRHQPDWALDLIHLSVTGQKAEVVLQACRS